MTLEEFTRLLNTYGTDLSRWPEEQRDAADLLRRTSEGGLQRWSTAEALEALFRQDRDRTAAPERSAAILNAALRRIRNPPERSFDWRRFISRRWGAAAAATVLAGWLAGVVFGPTIQPFPERGTSVVSVLLGDETASIEDLL